MKIITREEKIFLKILLLSSFLLFNSINACSLNKTDTDKNILSVPALKSPPANSGSADLVVSGRALYKDKAVEGTKVLAYRSVDDIKKGSFEKAVSTDDDGNYSIELTVGRYFFIARKDDAYFSYSGRNPINLKADEKYWIGFRLEKTEQTTITDYDDEFSSAISGRVLYDDAPVENAYVSIFLDDSDDFKGPGYSIASTNVNGEFFFDYLPESDYYIFVRKRHSGEKVGPIYEDDLYSYFPGNPLHTINGKTMKITINCISKIDDERAVTTSPPSIGFSGRVLDVNGKPVKGAHVFAYTDPVIGHKRPSALSLATKEDGAYVVELKKGGTYYIGARQLHGDSPEPGELFGMYDVTADHSIVVDTDTFLKDINITVEEIMLK